jgi:ribosomal protein S18 acetylase RimI-like enzyme
MDEKILTRPALPADAPSIARVHIQSWRETYPGLVPRPVLDALDPGEREKAWLERLEAGDSDGRFNVVGELRGKGVLGFASGGALRRDWALEGGFAPALLSKFDGEFQALYVARAGQGCGLGRALFRQVCEGLKRRGFSSMLVRVLKGNPACGFYERMGGIKAGEGKVKIGELLDDLAYGWDRIP